MMRKLTTRTLLCPGIGWRRASGVKAPDVSDTAAPGVSVALPPDLAARMADHVNDALSSPPPLSAAALAKREDPSPLVAEMQQIIRIRGPLNLPEFMRTALQHPIHGYYTSEHSSTVEGGDVFGRRGDFITSPEVSQVFGELVGLWCVATWRQMGSPSGFRLVELGPGRGTLMDDLLRAASKFDDFTAALERVEMVETSPVLAEIQRTTLGCVDDGGNRDGGSGDDAGVPNRHGIDTQWRHRLNDVPACPVLLVGHELLDALPAHQFELTERGWCERMVGVAPEEDESGLHFSLVLSPAPTLASEMLLKNFPHVTNTNASTKDGKSSSAADPHQAEAAAIDGRGRVAAAPVAPTGGPRIGDVVEVSPAAAALVQDIALRVRSSGGAALLLDYGDETGGAPSLRGVRAHKFVDMLSQPGRSDITADVDFGAMRRAVESLGSVPEVAIDADAGGPGAMTSGDDDGEKKKKVENVGRNDVAAFGPIEQAHFLHQMGIGARIEGLVGAVFEAADAKAKLNANAGKGGAEEGTEAAAQAEAQDLVEAYHRLAGREEGQMGKIYKVFAIGNAVHGTPVAFEEEDTTVGVV